MAATASRRGCGRRGGEAILRKRKSAILNDYVVKNLATGQLIRPPGEGYMPAPPKPGEVAREGVVHSPSHGSHFCQGRAAHLRKWNLLLS